MEIALCAGIVILLVVAPVLAGPPSRSEPWQAIAWLPHAAVAIVVTGAIVLVFGGMMACAVYEVLINRHTLGSRSEPSDYTLPFVALALLSMIAGSILGEALGLEAWQTVALQLVGLPLVGIGAAGGHGMLVSIGWLHEETEGCCSRSTARRNDRVNRIATKKPSTAAAATPINSAFGGSQRSKDNLLSALAAQRSHGAIGLDQPEAICDFRTRLGCPVPCQKSHLTMDGAPDKEMDEHHGLWQALYGVPEPLSALEDAVFSNLPLELAAAWPERFAGAIPPGADLTTVRDRWLLWLLDGEDSPLAPIDEQLEPLAGLLRQRLAGDEPDTEAWNALAGTPGKSRTEGVVAQAAAAAARPGATGATRGELDAARAVAECALFAGRVATRRERAALIAERPLARKRAALAARGIRRKGRARARWLAGIIMANDTAGAGDEAHARVWTRMSDQLVNLISES